MNRWKVAILGFVVLAVGIQLIPRARQNAILPCGQSQRGIRLAPEGDGEFDPGLGEVEDGDQRNDASKARVSCG